jgi:hypothetical protein
VPPMRSGLAAIGGLTLACAVLESRRRPKDRPWVRIPPAAWLSGMASVPGPRPALRGITAAEIIREHSRIWPKWRTRESPTDS